MVNKIQYLTHKCYTSFNIQKGEEFFFYNLQNLLYINQIKKLGVNHIGLIIKAKGKYTLTITYQGGEEEKKEEYTFNGDGNVEILLLTHEIAFVSIKAISECEVKEAYYYSSNFIDVNIKIYYLNENNNNAYQNSILEADEYLKEDSRIKLQVISSAYVNFLEESISNYPICYIEKGVHSDFIKKVKELAENDKTNYDYEILIDDESYLDKDLLARLSFYLSFNALDREVLYISSIDEFDQVFYENKGPHFSYQKEQYIRYVERLGDYLEHVPSMNRHIICKKHLIDSLDDLFAPYDVLTCNAEIKGHYGIKSIAPIFIRGSFKELKWNATNEYYFLRNLYLNKKIHIKEAKKHFKYYLNRYGMIARTDLVKAFIYAYRDNFSYKNKRSGYNLRREIENLNFFLMTPNELPAFYDEDLYLESNEERDDKYLNNQIENFNDSNFDNKVAILDLYNPSIGNTFGATTYLYFDKKRLTGVIINKEEDTKKYLTKLFKEARWLSLFKFNWKLLSNEKEQERLNEASYIENKKEISNNIIAFYVGTRLGFTCSPKYILLSLLKEKNNYEITWIAHKEEMCNDIYDPRLKIVSLASKEVIDILEESKVIVSNDFLPTSFKKKEEQILINTWHGGVNYKKIGYEEFDTPIARKIFSLMNKDPTYLVCGSREFKETTLKSFDFKNVKTLDIGLPRNDILFNKDGFDSLSFKKKLNIENKKVLLYVPTWRNGNVADMHQLNIDRILSSLVKRFGGEWVILYRGHAFTTNFWTKNDAIIDVSNYPDTQELLLISDALISDYSSIMWDALFLDIPIFNYAPDVDNYLLSDRGFFVSKNQFPTRINCSNDGLVKDIELFDNKTFINNKKKHLSEMGSFETNNSCATIVQIINEVLR